MAVTNKNKALLFFLLAGFFILPNLFSQEKILEKSHKKSPDWIGATLKGYIITSATADDLESAKDQLIPAIKEEIVNAVASYVRSESEINIENINRSNVVHTVETYRKSATIQTADIPFLKGISLSKAEDYYWVKSQNKNTKKISWTYYIKYPFSDSELKKLIWEFNKQDQEMTGKLDQLSAQKETVNSVEEIMANIQQLKMLADYFIDNRKEKAQLEISQYQALTQQIDIQLLENNPGELIYQLVVGERVFETSLKPKFTKPPCIQIIKNEKDGLRNIIDYHYADCYEDEENYITIEYRIAGKKLSKKYVVDISANKVELALIDPVRIKGNTDGTEIMIPLQAKFEGRFTVKRVELEIPGNPDLIFDKLNNSFSGGGTHFLNLNAEPGDAVEKLKTENNKTINGVIYYEEGSTGVQERLRIYKHKLVVE